MLIWNSHLATSHLASRFNFAEPFFQLAQNGGLPPATKRRWGGGGGGGFETLLKANGKRLLGNKIFGPFLFLKMDKNVINLAGEPKFLAIFARFCFWANIRHSYRHPLISCQLVLLPKFPFWFENKRKILGGGRSINAYYLLYNFSSWTFFLLKNQKLHLFSYQRGSFWLNYLVNLSK